MDSESFEIVLANSKHLDEASLIADKNNESIIYLGIEKKERKAIGFMQIYPSFSSITMEKLWILNDLYIVLEARECGVGRSLIETARKFVKQSGCKRSIFSNWNR